MEDKEIAGKLWELANLVTAFSVVQSLATMFAIVKGDLDSWLIGPNAHLRALAGIVLFTIVYEISVIYCGHKGGRLDLAHRGIWSTITVGRSIAVLLFSGVLAVVICGHPPNSSQLPVGGTVNASRPGG